MDTSPERDTIELFLSMLRKSVRQNNAVYQQVFILWYMLYDPQLFGRWMLEGEDHGKATLFMGAIKQIYHYLTNGWKLNGTMFQPGDNTCGRCGEFLRQAQALFLRSCC